MKATEQYFPVILFIYCRKFFCTLAGSKGRGAVPQGHENKGNKTIRQNEKQETRVTYSVKRLQKGREKTLLKDYIQFKKTIVQNKKERRYTLEPHSLKSFSKKRPQCNQQRGEQREGRHAHSSKTNSEPRKPQYSQQRRPRGSNEKENAYTKAKLTQSH